MPFVPGDVLGHYKILAPIGEGGMGAVYRARDTKLDRDVAIKVLPEAFARDPERLARFEREAKVLASLNHPNIAAIYGVEERALIMELVEGEAPKGPLPLPEVREIAAQMADALEYAHGKGIIHRDLKPANIMITAEGVVKLLDFGLAKAFHEPTPDFENSPTVTMGATQAGVILGTAAYMSPEQARGKKIDTRADIWAFGVVLFELLSGKRLFTGDSIPDILVNVATLEPDWDRIPSQARPLLQRCLQKDPRKRLRDMGDAMALLEVSAMNPAITGGAAGHGSRRLTWVWPAVALVLAVIALLAWFRPQPETSGATPNFALTIAPPSATGITEVGQTQATPEISPDGSAVIYHSHAGALLLRRLDSVIAQPVVGMEGKINPAYWATDSKSVLFANSNSVKRMRLPDGAPETLASISEPLHGFSEAPDGTILFGGVERLFAIPPGGEAKPVATPGVAKAGSYRWPEFLPGSKDFLVEHQPFDGSESEVYIATLGDGTISNPVLLMKSQTAARYTPAGGGRILFVRNDNLYAQKLNRETRKLEGEPEVVEQGVASSPEWGVGHFSVSRSGAVAWRPGRAVFSQVVMFNRQGKQTGTAGPPGIYRSLKLSPDENRLLVDGTAILEPNQLGSLRADGDLGSTWSSDGAHLLLTRDGRILEHPLGGGQDRELAKVPGIQRVEDISPDGKLVLYSRGAMTDAIYAARLDGASEPDPKPVIRTGATIMNPRFSPDGRWIVYAELTSFPNISIYVQPFPATGSRQQVANTGNRPIWRKDGKEIFYLTGEGVWSVRVDSGGGQVRFATPEMLFPTGRMAPGITDFNFLAVSRDGSRFYLPLAVEQPDSNVIHVRMGSAGR